MENTIKISNSREHFACPNLQQNVTFNRLLLKQVVGCIVYHLLCDLHPLRVSWFLVTVTFAQELSAANRNTPTKSYSHRFLLM